MAKKTGYLFAAVALAVLLTVVIGCSRKERDRAGKKYLVIFNQANSAEPYRSAQNKLMKKLFAEYGDIELVIKDAQGDSSRQIAQIETIIRQKPDLLIVAPKETQPPTKIMGKAMEAGITTICLERYIAKPNYTTFISCDNYAIGKGAGEFTVEKLKEKYGRPQGKIVEIRGDLDNEGEISRYNGANDVWKKYPDIRVIHTAVGDWSQSSGRERMVEILNARPEIDVCYAHNDPMAVGAYLAAKDRGREKEMIFVGIDGLGGPAGGIKKVQDGVLAVTFNYPLCVDKMVEIANRLLRDPDFKPKKKYMMDFETITPENAAEMYKKFTID